MPSEGTIILKFNQYQKSDKPPFIIYADLECLIEKVDRCKKGGEHILSGVSMSTISSFKSIRKRYIQKLYRGKDCLKKFCESLRELAMKIINFKNTKNEVINKRVAGII